MNVQNKEKGFTIIEVVLVLAIAGLIFLMVFIALPALQRNQRDTARKNDVSVVASAYTTSSNNNRGTAPANGTITQAQFGSTATGVHAFARYLDDLSDNSTSVLIKAFDATNADITDGAVWIVKNAKCGTSDGAAVAGTARQIAIFTKLEGGNAVFCQTS